MAVEQERDNGMSLRGKKLGVLLPHGERGMGGETPRGADVLALANMTEDAGFDSVWLVDHFLWHVPALDRFEERVAEGEKGIRLGYWECLTLASALAVTTSRVEIGTLVVNTGYRNPALLARMVDTVDELSAGRLILGLGAGGVPGEYDAFGYDYERRVGRFEEALQIIRPLLRGESVTFTGDFYRTKEAELRPKGVRAEGPPILIGLLKGGPRMQRLVAQYADQWNCWLCFGDSRVGAYREARAGIVVACEKHGRDPASLTKNVAVVVSFGAESSPGASPITGTDEEIADEIAAYLDEDVDHIVFKPDPRNAEGIEALARVLERLG